MCYIIYIIYHIYYVYVNKDTVYIIIINIEYLCFNISETSLVAQTVKRLPMMQV